MATPTKSQGPYKPTIILHGGAGSISRASLPPTLYKSYHTSLLANLTSTHILLLNGSSAIDAACHAVTQFEDDPLFNCGRGSVFTSAGQIEMEASLAVTCVDDDVEFEGKVKRSAAVSMMRRTRHPVLLAREVLRMGDVNGGIGPLGDMHGHLSGEEVERWGIEERGLEEKGPEWFWTKRRWDEHLRGLEGDGESGVVVDDLDLPSQGTAGAVCMDSWGVIAVATSTGGLTNKRPGRIGDTPTVGAGFWAESWTEQILQHQEHPGSKLSLSERLAASARSEVKLWLGDCIALGDQDGFDQRVSGATRVSPVEKEPLVSKTPQMTYPSGVVSRKRAVAMSGTGNGDSFLRTNACRTVAAIAHFSSFSTPVSFVDAIHAIAGLGGELQKSAGDRWGKTGEGEGGIIGVELIVNEGGKSEGRAVFDFNCSGLWRAFFTKDDDGSEKPCIMVFHGDY